MASNIANQDSISPFETTKTSFDARTYEIHKYSSTVVNQNQENMQQAITEEQQSIQNKRKKSFSPIKSFKIMQNLKKSTEQPFQSHPVMISSFTPEQAQTPKPLVNPKNAITYLLQHQTSRNPSLSSKRTDEQIDLIMKLIRGNRIWKDLGYEDSSSNSPRGNEGANWNQMLREICNSIVLSWSEIPNITETKPNEMYLILEGKTFQYIHNENAAIKLKIHENNDYIMIRKLVENDYFMTLAPQIKAKNKTVQNPAEKYQLMVDEKTLMGKISDQLFVKFIQKRLYERTRSLTSFMKKIVLFENLPDVVFHELSKFIYEKKIGHNFEIINANEKSKDIYFIKKGEVEFKLLTTKIDSEKSEEAKKQILRDYDVFGMDTLHTVKGADVMVQYSAKSLTECELYYIDKRILAIVISSFENEFKLQGKVIKSIDINSQIKGQNYLSIKQQILSRNAERIKTSERRIRDVKLQSFSRKKSREVNTFIPEKDRLNQKKIQSKSNETKMRSSGGFNLLRSKGVGMRSQGSLVNLKDSTDSMFWNLKNKFESKYENKQFQGNDGGIYNNYVIPVMEEEEKGLKKSPTMRSNSSLAEFQRINQMQKQLFIRSQRGKSLGSPLNEPVVIKQFNQTARTSFVPKVQSKSTFFEHGGYSGKIQSEIIKNHIQKKIKNQLVKKAQEVLERKTSIQRNSIKSIKKFYQVESFSPTKMPEVVPPQKMTRKQLTEDLLERMANIKSYPLLSLIESERKKMDSLSKVKSKELKQVQQKREDQKKVKINQKKMLILDISSLQDENHSSEPLNRFSSSGSRILSQQT